MAVRRDSSFSPNSVEKDNAILQATCDLLGKDIPIVDETQLDETCEADVILSMARFPRTIQLLNRLEERGSMVVNSGKAVATCAKSCLQTVMELHHIPMPPSSGEYGYWIKRGDQTSQQEDDVVYCENEKALENAKLAFAKRGITDYVVQAHVKGDIVKFYGVGNHFFRYYYPTDDKQTKFSHELVNGKAQHFAFDESYLIHEVHRLADVVSLDIYGGDAIIDKDGRIYIIDFNDWPSFSRCREDAAKAIAKLLKDKMK